MRETYNSWPISRTGLRARQWAEATVTPTARQEPRTLTPCVGCSGELARTAIYKAAAEYASAVPIWSMEDLLRK